MSVSRRTRWKTTAAVLTRCRSLEELEDGYSLRYPATRAWRLRLARFASIWSEGYPHVRFEVHERGSEDGLVLEVRGPAGTKEWVASARHMLESPLNPAPTPWTKLAFGWRLLTSPLRVLPDFLVLGAKKCGTTSLYAYLIEHPNVRSALRKETHFFDAFHARGTLWYRTYFPTVLARGLDVLRKGRAPLTGEATPDYLHRTHVAERVARLLPDARALVVLRNPVDRAWSLYQHNRRSGIETLGFEEALDAEEERLAIASTGDDLGVHRDNFGYVRQGLYAEQLEAWRAHVAPERLLVVPTRRMRDERDAELRRVHDFLGLPHVVPPPLVRMNAAPYPPLDARTRERLAATFARHDARLFELLGERLW